MAGDFSLGASSRRLGRAQSPCAAARRSNPQRDARRVMALPIFVLASSDRFGHNVTTIPIKKTAMSAKNKMDCLSHDTTGTAKASAKPKKQIGSSDKFSPARKVPN